MFALSALASSDVERRALCASRAFVFGVLVSVVRTEYYYGLLLPAQSLIITFRASCRECRVSGWAVRAPGVEMLRFWVRVFGFGAL